MVRWLIIFVVISSVTYGQQVIEGKIVDAETGKPVPFASVGILGTSRGTSSNLYGQFTLSISEPVTLTISCIGYETLTISSSQSLSEIKLRPGVTKLNTIVITDKRPNVKKIVRKAFANIDENYNTRPFLQTFFYRHYCRDNGVYGRLVEAYVDVYRSGGYRSTQPTVGVNDEMRVTQLRRSLDNTKGAESHEPVSVKDILETDIVGYQASSPVERLSFFTNVSNLKVDFRNYTFIYNGITIYDGQEVYEVDFSFRKDSALTTSGKYNYYPMVSGTLYITTDNFAFVKTEQKKTVDHNVIESTVYYRKYDGLYYPYHSLVVGKNQNGALGKHDFHIELMSVEIEKNSPTKFTGDQPGRDQLLDIPYNPEFWASSTILKTTPLEDNIIKDLGGGQSLNKQFKTYREYQLNVDEGGKNAEEKFSWLKEFSKGKNILYLVFWSENFKPYLIELERAKQLNQKLPRNVKMVFISLDDDNDRWRGIVERFNFFSDGIINYRVGTDSKLARSLKVRDTPEFILIDQEGEVRKTDVRKPSDPLLLEDLQRMAAMVKAEQIED